MYNSRATGAPDTLELVSAALGEQKQLEGATEEATAKLVGTAGAVGETPLPEILGYRITHILHRGVQAIVYRALRDRDRTDVAIKVLLDDGVQSAAKRRRFEREIELLEKLEHPSIVPVLEHGEVHGHQFFVMPLVAGCSLDNAAERDAQTIRQKVELIVQVAEALEAAHRIGVIHRDLKPSNILVDERGEVHLIDFGLARWWGEAAAETPLNGTVTIAGQFIGSIPWSSPEHASCDPGQIDIRSEVYSLGVILYQLVVGVLPYANEGSPLALIEQIKNQPPDRPRSLAADVPRDLETILLKCLEKDPARRYQSVGGLRDDLQRWLAGDAIEAKRDSTLYVAWHAMRKHKLLTALVMACSVGGLLLGGTMTTLYQHARLQRDQLQLQLSQLEQRVKEPKSWMSAIQSADQLRDMDEEAGWQFMQTTWPKLDSVDTKQQFLKAVAFSDHPAKHRGLDLGMQDPEPQVTAWAKLYLREIALFEVAEDNDRYRKWFQANAEKSLGQVLHDSVTRLAGEIATAQASGDQAALASRLKMLDEARLVSGPAVDVISAAVQETQLASTLVAIANDSTHPLAPQAIETLVELPLTEAFVRRHLVPLVSEGNSIQRREVAQALGRIKSDWAVDALLAALRKEVPPQNTTGLWTIAGALGGQGDPRAIPTMIAVIDGDNTYDTVYGVGYFGLGKLTGVNYDESHDGSWWRTWWENNRGQYELSNEEAVIPALATTPDPDAGKFGEVRTAAGEPMARFILHRGGGKLAEPPAKGYRLLVILPGGDGSADFQPFCENIARNAVDERFLVVQLIAPVWNPQQAQQLVWPTSKNKVDEAKFSTEGQLSRVLKEVGKDFPLDPSHRYTLSWSSGGPAGYALSLDPDLKIAGSFIAMSIYKPNQLPPLKAAKGHAFYLLHSPQDFIQMRFPERAQKELSAAGATVNLVTYDGGHGWHGDVLGNIKRGMVWLAQETEKASQQQDE